MILEGNERGFGTELARHLLNRRDNDHVTVHSVDGFVASDLAGAFAESAAIAQGTQCRKHLFSLSLNPPLDARVSVAEFEDAINRAEKKLGLAGQPRAIVFHEKHGRLHAHCVWSRIDASRMRAINIAHSKRKLMDVSVALYREHGWAIPAGFSDHVRHDPLNFSRVEAGQAKKAGHDPKAVKGLFQRCWERSDSRASFAATLWAEGYCLAQGDRRGFVAVDAQGKIWSLSRWCGVKTRELRNRLGEPDDLPTMEEALRLFEGMPLPEQSTKVPPPNPDFEESLRRLVQEQRRERDALMALQERRVAAENTARQARLPSGLKAVWFRLNGRYGRLVEELEREAASCALRDQNERQALIERHLEARRGLDRRRAFEPIKALDAIFLAATRPDHRQTLVVPKEAFSFTPAQLERKPSLVLAHLSHKQARFSKTDVKRALAAFIDNPLVLRSAIDSALTAPELVQLDTGDFTTQDYQDAQHRLDAATLALAETGGFAVAGHHISRAAQEQDTRMRERFGGCLSDEQKAALSHILGDDGFSCVVGLAGSGKSTMLDTARRAWAAQGVRVHGAALSGKAAEGLQKASGIESRTLASLETSWKNGYEPIARGDVLVIDEAGMVGVRQMMRVAEKLRRVGAKLVLVGDPGQLQPIEAGTPFRELIDQHGAARLNEIHRQKEAWQRHASRDLAEGRLREALGAYDANGSVRHCAKLDTALSALLEQYVADREVDGRVVSQLAFAHRRKDVFALNQAIRQALRALGEPASETILATEIGPRAFARGDRIVFTRNDKDLGVKNGMLGTVATVDEGHVGVLLDSDENTPHRVTFDPQRYRSFDHGYAVTIHKSQGATVDRAYVLFSRTMDAPLTYVAMTRHREALRLYVNGKDRPSWVEPGDGYRPWQQPARTRTFDWS